MSAPEQLVCFDVFLSYHSGDASWAAKLKAALEKRALKVWLDSDQILPGDRFAEALEQGLSQSKAVALLVSSGSLKSEWVKEEYYRAMGLANTVDRGLRLIPVLIESVSLPGFLSSRSWADFRDSSRFDQSLERLCLGIQGVRPTKTPSDAATPQTAQMDELDYLDRSLQRESHTVRQLRRMRFFAPSAGVAVFGISAILAPGVQVLLAIGAPLVTGLIGWAVTARQMSASQINLARLAALKDGLELCRGKTGAGCPRLWAEFWRIVHRNAGLDTV